MEEEVPLEFVFGEVAQHFELGDQHAQNVSNLLLELTNGDAPRKEGEEEVGWGGGVTCRRGSLDRWRSHRGG